MTCRSHIAIEHIAESIVRPYIVTDAVSLSMPVEPK